jgi:hypothetical protein
MFYIKHQETEQIKAVSKIDGLTYEQLINIILKLNVHNSDKIKQTMKFNRVL